MHPSDLGEKKFRRTISKQMKNRLGKWDARRQAILTSYKGKFQVLKGGKGRIVDSSTPYVQYSVKVMAEFAKPKVGSEIRK